MGEPVDATLPRETAVHHFLDRALLVVEWGALALLFAATLVQPQTGRTGLPTWGLILLYAGYLLVVDLVRSRVRRLHAFALKYVIGIPVTAVIYFLGAEPGGVLFVLLVLAVVCAACTLSMRGSLIYTATVAVLLVLTDPTFPAWSPAEGDVRDLGARLALLVLFGASTAILTRRLAMEQRTVRSARGEAERLAELERLRMLFVSSVSHDLRTPLTAARAGLGLLQAAAAERLEPGERDLLANVRRNTERLGLLIEDLLAYNQLETGTLQLDRQPLDLRAVVMSAMGSVHPLIREKGQVVEIDLPEPLPSEGDARRLEQVFVDLLANAHLHTPERTRIAISGRALEHEIQLSVADTGPGIPQEELPSVFQRFHRSGWAEGGSGLGLAIAKGIVEMHGGRIWAESRRGEGATFRLVLPRGGNS